VDRLIEYYAENKTISGYNRMKERPREKLFSVPCDILCPCALENAIHAFNAEEIKAKIIVEGANGPVTSKAEEILNRRGVLIVPDIIANAGGVIVSYFEWVQNLHNYYWTFEEVQEKQYAKMKSALLKMLELSKKEGLSLREACYLYSVGKLATVTRLRGICT